MEKRELQKNKTRRDVLREEYFEKAASIVYEAISNAYNEGYHTGWMRAAKFYRGKLVDTESKEGENN